MGLGLARLSSPASDGISVSLASKALAFSVTLETSAYLPRFVDAGDDLRHGPVLVVPFAWEAVQKNLP